MENNIIENIKIAELDSNKVYFMQIESSSIIHADQLRFIAKMLEDKFKEYDIKNIMLFTPLNTEIKFTEVNNGE